MVSQTNDPNATILSQPEESKAVDLRAASADEGPGSAAQVADDKKDKKKISFEKLGAKLSQNASQKSQTPSALAAKDEPPIVEPPEEEKTEENKEEDDDEESEESEEAKSVEVKQPPKKVLKVEKIH